MSIGNSSVRPTVRSNYPEVIELFGLFSLSFSSSRFCSPFRVTGVWQRQLYSIIAWPKCFSEYSETHRLVYLINHAASLIFNVKSRPRLHRAFSKLEMQIWLCHRRHALLATPFDPLFEISPESDSFYN